MNDFFSDPKAIAMFEKHIAALLNHKSTLTGIALKDDPTVMAWENCNMCGIVGMMSGPNQGPAVLKWVDTIGAFIKSIDKKHLYSDNSGFYRGWAHCEWIEDGDRIKDDGRSRTRVSRSRRRPRSTDR
jgi:mannan endo-1,4-beta-mannosidase